LFATNTDFAYGANTGFAYSAAASGINTLLALDAWFVRNQKST
jgi:hypothetical protein